MKIENKTLMVTLSHPVQVGDLNTTLECQIFYNGTPDFDLEFADIKDTTFCGVPIDGYDNWRKFKVFHKEMGIDFDSILDQKFGEVFTLKEVREIIQEELKKRW